MQGAPEAGGRTLGGISSVPPPPRATTLPACQENPSTVPTVETASAVGQVGGEARVKLFASTLRKKKKESKKRREGKETGRGGAGGRLQLAHRGRKGWWGKPETPAQSQARSCLCLGGVGGAGLDSSKNDQKKGQMGLWGGRWVGEGHNVL